MRRGLWAITACSLIAMPARSDEPGQLTLDGIVLALKTREKALESFEVQGRELFVDGKTGEILEAYHSNFLWAETSSGCREFRMSMERSDGTCEQLDWYRDDEKFSYGMKSFEKSANLVDSMVIEPLGDDPFSKGRTKNSYIHVLMPRGRRLSDLVSTAEEFEFEKDSAGNRTIILKMNDRGVALTLKLAEARDFLPVVVDLAGSVVFSVNEFTNVQGFWMPKSGSKKYTERDGRPAAMNFVADSIRINSDYDASRFGPPKLESGAMVYNQVTGKNHVHGFSTDHSRAALGARAAFVKRNELEKEKEKKNESQSQPRTNSIPSGAAISTKASTEPEPGHLRLILVSGAIGFLAIAIFMSTRK